MIQHFLFERPLVLAVLFSIALEYLGHALVSGEDESKMTGAPTSRTSESVLRL